MNDELKVRLLDKTELRIENIKLDNVNLTVTAEAVAEVLDLNREEVIVTDASNNHILFDILRQTLNAQQFYGKEKPLLEKLSKVPGIELMENTSIHSQGVLGLITLDEKTAQKTIKTTLEMKNTIKQIILKRAIVYTTGNEVKNKLIKDTNTPILLKILEVNGYKATEGKTLEDDEDLIAANIQESADSGYGLIILTGGVGAEEKDRTVEGVLKVVPNTYTPYIMKFEKGSGRHVKDGVKIAVGRKGLTTIIALPGPTEEAKLGLESVVNKITEQDIETIAEKIAETLRKRLEKINHRKPAHIS